MAVPRPIILDCDPGHDDALAMLLALARPELDVLAITTVAGNAPLERTTRSALRVLTLAGRTDVPVAAGAAESLTGQRHTAPSVHGASGLDGADLPEPQVEPVAETALELMTRLLETASRPITLVPTGPLTNVAQLIAARPDLVERVDSICLMGGAIGEGNWTASAEFNIWADPEAAAAVFACGRPIAMHGLDVTHQARLRPAEIEAMDALGNRTGRVFADLMRYYARYHAERYGWDGPPIHDAVAVAHTLGLGIVETRAYPVAVETEGRLTRGRTVVDVRPFATGTTVDVGVGIDRERFVGLLLEAVASFP
ncbi:MAG: pyrimidine-specific ribonucleoside hydrolase [Chloroflexota bacterium]|jgi:inosine-uridine nucleoside N-ribohydrolase|nr:pyrimidine-specific ribonucleoside hydrolase [Chloroflexota bacterium]